MPRDKTWVDFRLGAFQSVRHSWVTLSDPGFREDRSAFPDARRLRRARLPCRLRRFRRVASRRQFSPSSLRLALAEPVQAAFLVLRFPGHLCPRPSLSLASFRCVLHMPAFCRLSLGPGKYLDLAVSPVVAPYETLGSDCWLQTCFLGRESSLPPARLR